PSVPPCSSPSFPTRRSSDLVRAPPAQAKILRSSYRSDSPLRLARRPAENPYSSTIGPGLRAPNSPHASALFIRTSGRVLESPGGDRKSTRLNSSHQIISYAV